MPTVLVADDSAVALLTVARRLRAGGLLVSEHSCAASARDASLDGVACALLDLDLGDGDGASLAAALRVKRPHLKIAFFSASVSEDLLIRARAVGPVFGKPSDLEAAIAWVMANAVQAACSSACPNE